MKEEELKKMTVKEVIELPEFLEEMKVQVKIEQDTHTEEIARGRLRRTPLDAIREKGVLCAEKMVELFASVVAKTLEDYSSSERQYIYGVGMLCFGRVLNRLRE